MKRKPSLKKKTNQNSSVALFRVGINQECAADETHHPSLQRAGTHHHLHIKNSSGKWNFSRRGREPPSTHVLRDLQQRARGQGTLPAPGPAPLCGTGGTGTGPDPSLQPVVAQRVWNKSHCAKMCPREPSGSGSCWGGTRRHGGPHRLPALTRLTDPLPVNSHSPERSTFSNPI